MERIWVRILLMKMEWIWVRILLMKMEWIWVRILLMKMRKIICWTFALIEWLGKGIYHLGNK
ncbi:hypothetical protein KY290_018442 [Solanum tuberosum]|uniref:Uncharacterized protein n=1 Tax=Solanum tuberosum TaxID=4113 RepID=A0ABQ7VFK9_SOLTU|nr:hypothetical protein KY290_018442 [Solanum tuberosum]